MTDANHQDNEAFQDEEDDKIGKEKEKEDKKENQESRELANGKKKAIDTHRQDSVPLLFAAINAGNVDRVRVLLNDTHEFINSTTYGGLTPLHAACHMQHLDILKLLLSREAKVTCLDSLGNTALHVAVAEGWHDGIEELLSQGASPNKMNEPPNTLNEALKETPLHVAVRKGDKTSLTLLLKSKPNIHIRNSQNYSVFHLAASKKDLPLLKLLLAEEDSPKQLNDIARDGFSLFHAALTGEQSVEKDIQILKVIQAIHKFSDAVNQVNLLGESPLILACYAGLPNVVKFFLANGADPTQVTRERQSTLHASCMSGCVSTLRHLLSTGRVEHLICSKDNNGNHPFYHAVMSGSVDCCKTLLENGEHLTNLNSDGVSNCTLVIRQLPSAMQMFRDLFDASVKLSKKPQHDSDYNITFDYSPLMSSAKGNMQSSIVSELAGTALEPLIKHPLLESFLYIKWCKIRQIFYLNFLEFFVYLIIHTSFVMRTFGHDSINWSENRGGLLIFQFFHIFFLLVIFIPGVVVTLANYRKYLLQWETYTRFLAILCSAIVIFMTTVSPPDDLGAKETTLGNQTTVNAIVFTNVTSSNQNLTGDLSPARTLASMSLFFGWVELMMLLGRFPALGAYILMFTKVGKSVIKFLLSFLSLLVGFSLSFHILFLQMPVFADYKLSFAKTLMMMTGEIAYSEFVNEKGMPFSTYSLVVLSVFLFMVTVIMSNLLIGLAVNDLPDLKRQGKIKRLVKQAAYLMAYERLMLFTYNMKLFPRKLHRFMSSKCNIKSPITIYPNQELKRHKYMQTIPGETLQEAITLGSCENPEDFPTLVEEDFTSHLKAFHIRYSSDRRTQRHKFSDISNMCGNIQIQMDQLQLKMDKQLSHMSMQLQQQLQQNQNLYNHLTQNKPGHSPKEDKK